MQKPAPTGTGAMLLFAAVAESNQKHNGKYLTSASTRTVIRYQSRASSPISYPGTWRPGWTEVPGGGFTKNTPAVTRNGSTVTVLVTGGGAPNDAWENTLGTAPGDGAFIATPPLGSWSMIPKTEIRPIPVNSDGQPIPDPDNPGPPPAQPVLHWYVYCMSGPGVQDGYIPALEENQTAGLAQATAYATKNYGPAAGHWQLTLHANPTPTGCDEVETEYKWCVTKYEWPGEAYWPTYTITNYAASYGAGLENAKSQVRAAHGPEYNDGHQGWEVTAYDPNQCI